MVRNRMSSDTKLLISVIKTLTFENRCAITQHNTDEKENDNTNRSQLHQFQAVRSTVLGTRAQRQEPADTGYYQLKETD